MTSQLEELKEQFDLEAGEVSKGGGPHSNRDIVQLSGTKYMDNGYGNWFNSDILIDYNVNNDCIEEIRVDGLTNEELDKKLDEVISKCYYQRVLGECRENVAYSDGNPEKALQELLEDHDEQSVLCGDCETIVMLQGLIDSINS